MLRTRRAFAPLLVMVFTLGLLVAPAAAAPEPPAPPADGAVTDLWAGQIQFQQLVSGLASPLGVVNAGDGTNRLFVLERQGTVRVVVNRQLQPGNFMDIRGVSGGLTSGGEEGLLGLAFHPSFETNRKLFAYYTNGGGDLSIAEFTANAEGTSVSAATYDLLLNIPHPTFTNHNGGQLAFGPDGHLYAFVGDGGGGGDPGENAQDVGERLGKVLRIAPNLAGGYTIPAGNPFPGPTDGFDEIWAYGVRNPWRASFDRSTGDLWIADVGQDNWEEVNKATANPAGLNYGWDNCEGMHPFEGSCAGTHLPVAEYATAGANCSITGGYVYRGAVYGHFVGEYILGDFCSGNVWTLDAASPAGFQHHADTAANITSFGEAEDGEIYMTDFNGGRLWKVVAPTFGDVLGSMFIDDITWLHFQGISNGCGGGNYCPTSTVSREQMASFLARALNLPPSSTNHFSDDDGSIHEADINRVADAGITLGCAPGQYCPTNPVTRAQMASFLARALDLPPSSTNHFWDDDGNMHEADINKVADAGITLGCGSGQYCPGSVTTREQMAAFIRRART